MINASISEDGSVVLSAFGHDADTLKTFKGTFEVVPVGSNINTKTGRKHFVIKLIPVSEDQSDKDDSYTKKIKPSVVKKKRTQKEEDDFKDQLPKVESQEITFDTE